MNINDVLIAPLVTEKSTLLQSSGYYTFKIHPAANKIMVKNAVEKIFSVKVLDCKISNVKPKLKALRTRRGFGKTSSMKKAMVRIQGDQTISELAV